MPFEAQRAIVTGASEHDGGESGSVHCLLSAQSPSDRNFRQTQSLRAQRLEHAARDLLPSTHSETHGEVTGAMLGRAVRLRNCRCPSDHSPRSAQAAVRSEARDVRDRAP